ncbi:MAG: M14 family metallopeptidase [Betaproteobacteria bacterium]
MRTAIKRSALAVALVLCAAFASAQAIPTPSDFLHVKVGGDGVLASYDQIVAYLRAIAPMSNRLKFEDLGPTTMGHPFVNVIITSPENMQKLEYYRDLNNRLHDPRRTSPEEAGRLITEGRTVVAIQMSIHSTEVAAAQLSMELAHFFATDNSPRTKEILDNCIILMTPSHNPDGTQMVAEWNQKTLGTKFEGSSIPFLYHKYVGHDDNRDWYMFTQKESRITVEKIWNRWHPEISYDMHQMGANAARLFIPPYVDPWDPNVNPILISEMSMLGSTMAAELTGQGKDGVLIHGIYDGWTPARGYTNYHGGIRFLTEAASARLASPITLTFEQLGRGIGYDAKQVAWNFPRPWRGGTWHLRDIMDYEFAAANALLDNAAKYRETWLTNFYRINEQAVGRRDPLTGRDKPYAIVFPAAQRDPAATYKLLETLQFADVEVSRAKAPFTADGRTYAAGTHVILMAQPSSAFAKTLTEVQHYPDLRQYPGGPPQRPYDVTAYTMPLMMGVDCVHVQQPFQADLELLSDPITAPAGSVDARAKKAYVFAHDNAGIMATTRLTKAGVKVLWANAPFAAAGTTYPAGAIVIPVAGQPKAIQKTIHDRVAAVAKDLPLAIHAVDGAVPAAVAVRAPRVGLYKSYVPSMDEGWTRWIFEQWGIDYTSLENKDVAAGGLRDRFDVIVLPQQGTSQMLNGFAPGSMPAEYVGGLKGAGVAALKAFVDAGGTLVALDSASMMPIEEFKLPVTNVLAGLSGGRGGGGQLGPESAAFYAPGSIVKADVDVASPIAYGASAEEAIWFEQSPAFEVSGGAKAIVTYPASGSPLLSGWLLGAEKLNGKAAVVEAPVGSGRVILFGFRPQYRAQTWATFKLLFNSLYYATMNPPATASHGNGAGAR